MYPIRIEAPQSSVASSVRDRLATELRDRGPVAIIEYTAESMNVPSGAGARYQLGADGWTASGKHRDLRNLLETLAPDYEFALITGATIDELPTLAIGNDPGTDTVFLRVESPDDVTADRVHDELESVEPFETLPSLVADIKQAPSADRAGAIATFTGRVRARDHADDARTDHLEFEKYAGVAEERMAALSSDLEEREGVYAVTMHHRTGILEAGQDIVFVVVLAGHRDEAFQTVADGINRLKAEVPIFKKEVTVEESFWVHDHP